eukprot:3587682-Pyramimonas_sp.AAC.1
MPSSAHLSRTSFQPRIHPTTSNTARSSPWAPTPTSPPYDATTRWHPPPPKPCGWKHGGARPPPRASPRRRPGTTRA